MANSSSRSPRGRLPRTCRATSSLAEEARHRSPRRCRTPSFRGFPSTSQDGSHKRPGRQCGTSAGNGTCGSALGRQDRSRRGGVTNERGRMSWLLPCRSLIGLNAATSSVAYSSTNPEPRRAHRRGAARGRRGSAVLTMRRPRQAGPPKASRRPSHWLGRPTAFSALLREELESLLDELLVELEDSAVAGVRVDHQLVVRDTAGHVEGVRRRQHPVVIAVREEYGVADE